MSSEVGIEPMILQVFAETIAPPKSQQISYKFLGKKGQSIVNLSNF